MLLRRLYKLVWDIEVDVRNFFVAYHAFLDVLFREEHFHESIADQFIELINEVAKLENVTIMAVRYSTMW